MEIKLGKSSIVVNGEKYSLTIQAIAYDKELTVINSTTIVIDGEVTEGKDMVQKKIEIAKQELEKNLLIAEEFRKKIGDI
jgi:hypothetical protein